MKERIDNLESENKSLNERIQELEANSETASQTVPSTGQEGKKLKQMEQRLTSLKNENVKQVTQLKSITAQN